MHMLLPVLHKIVTGLLSGIKEMYLLNNVKTRLAAIDGDDGYTGVKPQHRYVTCPLRHRPPPSFRFF